MPDTDDMIETLKLVQALHHIASESEEPDIIRYAFGALASTEAGVAYMTTRPVLV